MMSSSESHSNDHPCCFGFGFTPSRHSWSRADSDDSYLLGFQRQKKTKHFCRRSTLCHQCDSVDDDKLLVGGGNLLLLVPSTQYLPFTIN